MCDFPDLAGLGKGDREEGPAEAVHQPCEDRAAAHVRNNGTVGSQGRDRAAQTGTAISVGVLAGQVRNATFRP